MKKFLGALLLASLLFSVGGVFAADDANVTVTTGDSNIYDTKEVVWFSAYDVGGSTGATYDYNIVQGAGDSDGLVECNRYNDYKTIQIDVITLGSTSIDVRVEGRAGSSAEWGDISGALNFDAVTGANGSYIVEVTEALEEIRVGVKANTPGTDSVTITGWLMGRYR